MAASVSAPSSPASHFSPSSSHSWRTSRSMRDARSSNKAPPERHDADASISPDTRTTAAGPSTQETSDEKTKTDYCLERSGGPRPTRRGRPPRSRVHRGPGGSRGDGETRRPLGFPDHRRRHHGVGRQGRPP